MLFRRSCVVKLIVIREAMEASAFMVCQNYLPLAQAASFMRILTQIHKDRTLLITRGIGPGWLLVHDDKNRVREVLVFR